MVSKISFVLLFGDILSLKNKKIPASIPLGLQSKALHENIEKMKAELIEFGPIQGAFSVYPSFYDFFDIHPNGVYFLDPSGNVIGGHTSKIIGWGRLKDEPTSKTDPPKDTEYWILQNTWGDKWGDKGFYRMAMTESEDLAKLTKSNAFVIEYNAMASKLAFDNQALTVTSPVKNPITRNVKKNLWFWIGLIVTSLLFLSIVIWLVIG